MKVGHGDGSSVLFSQKPDGRTVPVSDNVSPKGIT